MYLVAYRSLLVAFLLIVSSPAFSQIAEDALLFGQFSPVGTARFQAIGGAGFALGGDVSAAALNPAGIGFFNRSSVAITPNLDINNITTNYENVSTDVSNTRLNIANFGLVINNSKDELIPSDWRGGSFAITYNQIRSFNVDWRFNPANSEGSVLDEFVRQSAGISVNELQDNIDNDLFIGYPEAAYFNFLINPDASNENYVASIPADATSIQNGEVTTSGRLSQWNIAYGGNYKDKLYLGVSLGIRGFNYQQETFYREEVVYTQEYIDFINSGGFFFPVEGGNVSIDFVNLNILDEFLEISGTGINGNFGIIYRPINELTVGLSYQTPTFYNLRSEEFFNLASDVRGIREDDDQEDPLNIFIDDPVLGNSFLSEYTLSTPSRTGLGLSYFFEKSGFISLDAEYVNYPKNRFSTNDGFSQEINENVDAIFTSVINARVGGEFRLKQVRFRAGYAFYPDPTQFGSDNLNRDRSVISGGIGYDTSSFFADLSVSNTQFETDFAPYLNGPFIPQSISRTQALLTLGFKF
ncbi:MAG: OmpP1/FadL family transporter [Cyclobacteriaceae bacterium]